MSKLQDIGFYTLCDDRAANSSASSPLWRCELIVTGECNFKCPYCRGTKDAEISVHDATNIVYLWANDGLKNIRFSGGEPTGWVGLPGLIAFAKLGGIERVAVSTNGSASMDYYKQLIGCGADDFSVSLDACCALTGDKMAGIPGAWDTVVENIRELSSLVYVTVGVVLLPENIHEFRNTIYFAKDLGVSDIRIISAAQWNKDSEIKIVLQEFVDDEMPILRYRARNLTNGRTVRGITPEDNRRCPLVLDDMAVKGKFHYPCIIYLREGGAPIGEMADDMGQVRAARAAWSLNHDTYSDPICKKNCLDVCIDYNNKVIERKNDVCPG